MRLGDAMRLHACSVGEAMPYVTAALGAARTLLRAPGFHGVSEAMVRGTPDKKLIQGVYSVRTATDIVRLVDFGQSNSARVAHPYEDAQIVALKLLRSASVDLNTAVRLVEIGIVALAGTTRAG